MEELRKGKIWEFDHQFCNRSTQLLKVLFWYTDAKMQPTICTVIKLLELRQCLSAPMSYPAKSTDFTCLYEDAKDYLRPEENDLFSQFQNMREMIKNYREMAEMMEMFKEMNASEDNTDSSNNAGFSANDLSGLLSPELASVFDLLKSMSVSESNTVGGKENA